jgi:hypothetical protein
LLHHGKSISEGNYHQLRPLTECLLQIRNGGHHRAASERAQSALCRQEGEGGYEEPSKQKFYFVVSGLKIIYHATPAVI